FLIILSVSQILLSVPQSASTPIALGIALFILLACAYYASARRVTRSAIVVGIAVPAIVIFSGGIIAGIYRQNNAEELSLAAEKAEKARAAGNAPLAPELATDNKFSAISYTVTAGKPTTIDFANHGSNPHNIDILSVKDAQSGADIKTEIVQPGGSAKLSFT